MPTSPVLALLLGDVVRLRRRHPCGGDRWQVDRLGADIGLRCQTCGRHVLVDRRLVERRLVEFVARGDAAISAAVEGRVARARGVTARSGSPGALSVFRNSSFLRLWLSQAATQIGGNMVLYGLTVIVVSSTNSNTAVSLLILTFLVPAVLFSAVAGVYVDRIDRRLILIATNVLRGLMFVALFLVGANLPLILLLNVAVSTVTVFFAPAEAAMIPVLVPRGQLLAANGVFTLTLNGAFALGFALLGPLVVNVANPEAVILVVAALYFLAAGFCVTLPAVAAAGRRRPGTAGLAVGEAERAVELDPVAASRGPRLHPLQPGDRLVAAVPGHRGVAGRRARRPRAGLRPVGARARGQGFRRRRAAARVRARDRHPAAQRLRPLPPATAGHRGWPDRPRGVAGGPVGGRPDQPAAPGGRRARRPRPVRGHLAPGDRGRHRLLRRHRLRPRCHPVADPAPGGPARGRPRPRLRRPQHARVRRELPARSSSSARSPTWSARPRSSSPWRWPSSPAASRRSCGGVHCWPPTPDRQPTRPPSIRSRRPSAPIGRPGASRTRAKLQRSSSSRRGRRRASTAPGRPTRPTGTDRRGQRRRRLHRRDDQHRLRSGRRWQRPDPRWSGDPRAHAGARRDRRGRGHRPGPHRRPATSRSRSCSRWRRAARGPGRPCYRRGGRRPGHRHDRGDQLLLGSRPRRGRSRSW